ncbi:MAG TPA: CPCC family cysteine-rich protein [Chloroflexia bacterium]|nr:CPCC family cysteine-rich protein [Chloroflexia bacterium]
MAELAPSTWPMVNGVLVEHARGADQRFYCIYELTNMTGDVLYGATRLWTLLAFRLSWSDISTELLVDWQFFPTLAEARQSMGNLTNEERGIEPFEYDKTRYTAEPERHYCLCCGYKTIEGYKTNFGYTKPPETYAICKICFWQDDSVAFRHPDEVIGPNRVSLQQAQRNFLEFGASERRVLRFVRPSNDNDVRDPNWRLL